MASGVLTWTTTSALAWGGRKAASPPPPPAMQSGHLLIEGYPAWLVGFAFLCVLHVVCLCFARDCRGWKTLGPLSRDPMLAAHFLPQLVAFAAAVHWGARDWMFHMDDLSGDDVGAYVPQGERIACLMIGFQLYELLACCFSPRLRGSVNELVVHHVIVCLLSSLVYYLQAFQYISPSFMGMAEISSLPLAFVDLFKQFPELRKPFPTCNEIVRNVFAVSFLVLRGVYWPYCSYRFFLSVAAVLQSAAGLPPNVPEWALYVFCSCNVLMNLLQWYWASIILKAIYYKAIGDERNKEA